MIGDETRENVRALLIDELAELDASDHRRRDHLLSMIESVDRGDTLVFNLRGFVGTAPIVQRECRRFPTTNKETE